MSVSKLLSPVIKKLPSIDPHQEISVLQEIPAETAYLALKESDADISLWFFENARTEQVQGILDLDCWKGADFHPERFRVFFQSFCLLTPVKLAQYMKELDPELVTRFLMESAEVLDFDPDEPLNAFPEEKILISPDQKYILFLKNENASLKESLYQWMNKLYAIDIDLARRHLETCKWEQISDLEEFAYRVKKGRIEEMGFVEREEAIALFSTGHAPDFKLSLLKNPLPEGSKKSFKSPLENWADNDFFPSLIRTEKDFLGFFRKSLEGIKDPSLKSALSREYIRSINAFLTAEDALQEDLDTLKKLTQTAAAYFDLGLLYLSQGQIEVAQHQMENQRFFHILRLGWLVVHDLVKRAQEIQNKYDIQLLEKTHQVFLKELTQNRNPHLSSEVFQSLKIEHSTLLNLEGVHKTAERLAQLSELCRYYTEELGRSLEIEKEPLESFETALSRLLTACFRQASGKEFSVEPLNKEEWEALVKNFDSEKLQKFGDLLIQRCPEISRKLFTQEFQDYAQTLINWLPPHAKGSYPDPRYCVELRLQEHSAEKPL